MEGFSPKDQDILVDLMVRSKTIWEWWQKIIHHLEDAAIQGTRPEAQHCSRIMAKHIRAGLVECNRRVYGKVGEDK